MSKPSTSKWPSYTVGPDTHMHALGVISVNYNGLELALDMLLREYLVAADDAHAFIFQNLNQANQLALFKICVVREKDSEVRQHLLDFCALFDDCSGNRNLLMHSNLDEPNTTDIMLGLAKRPKGKDFFNHMQFDLTELRRTADEMRAVFEYGFRLWDFLRKRRRLNPLLVAASEQTSPLPALPDRPPRPESLQARLQPSRKKS